MSMRVARQIGLGLGGVGLRFGQTRGGGFAIALGNSDGGFRVGDVGFGAGDVGAAFDLRDGNVGLLRGHLAAGLGDLGAGLIERDLEIARIEIHQRIARLHDLIVVHINARDGAVHARADGVQVSFHLGVVGGFELPRLEPKVDADAGGDQKEQEEDGEGAAAAASDRRLGLLAGQGRHLGRRVRGGGTHGRTPLSKVGKIGFGLSHGAGQSQAGQVESKQPGNVVAFGAGDLFLRLDHFHGGGHAGVKSVPRLAQGFIREAAIVFGEPDFADRGFQLDQRRADVLFDAAALIGEFRLALVESGLGLFDVGFHAAALIDGHVDGTDHRVHAVIGYGTGTEHSVIGGQRSGGKAFGARGGDHDFGGANLALGGLQIPAFLERLLHGAGGFGHGGRIERELFAQDQFAIEREADQTSQSELLLAQIGLERVEPLLLALQFDQGARDIDAGVGAGFFANFRLMIDGLRILHLSALRSDAGVGGDGLQICSGDRQDHHFAGVASGQGGSAFAFLAGVPVAALHRIPDGLGQIAEQLRILEGTDDGGDGEAEAGRQVELESECREIDLRAGFGGVDGDVGEQIAESAQALGSRGAGGIVGGEHAEIGSQAQLHGVGERET